MNQHIIEQTKTFVFNRFKDDTTGHDYAHMKRVATMAKYLAEKEQADPLLAELIGWLHDITDTKLTNDPVTAKQEVTDYLYASCLSETQVATILQAIDNISFRKGNVPTSFVGQIAQDADRLDAIGAIGIARAFSYGGSKKRQIYSENPIEKSMTTIQHFYDKLLLIKDRLHTQTAKQLAERRHTFMEDFLDHFFLDWEGK
ncbi:uncharacterized protein YedJ [Paraliobacillus ryukyuensis]|uniref:HD/PDEase domain-containing protein n=1 Tax=Paraliobacillus ryukyuensis TaxID=200904 RepID=A0A366EGX6_9BACI|nr:HD domain-containing protein [Paraliobacillus ryukyuensis]RBP01583.1 uncharacterized protein DES48_101321 [Paraliobacillus ryukyuensis]